MYRMYIVTTLEFPKYNFEFHLMTTSVNAKYYWYVHTVSFSSVFIINTFQKVSFSRRVHTKTDENNVNWQKRFQYCKRYLITVFAIENVFNCVDLRFVIMWTGKTPETLRIQNGEYYDIISVRWKLGFSAGNLGFELDINNNNNK